MPVRVETFSGWETVTEGVDGKLQFISEALGASAVIITQLCALNQHVGRPPAGQPSCTAHAS